MKPTKMTCQARILSNEMMFPSLGEKYFTTTCCESSLTIKMSVDDGDAHLGLCKVCLRRFIGRTKKPELWYGWFDCDYPPEARVKYSAWWREMNKKEVVAAAAAEAAAAAAKEAEAEAAEKEEEVVEAAEAVSPPLDELAEGLAKMAIRPQSKKELIIKKIAELNLWFNTPAAKKDPKEIKQKVREMINLKTQLHSI